MNYNIFLSIGILTLIISCESKYNPIRLQVDDKDTTALEDTSSTLHASLNQSSAIDKEIEIVMKDQLNKYNDALLSGRADEALNYCLPEMFTYFQKEYPEYDKEDIKDVLLRDTSRKFKEEMDKNGLKYEVEIGEVIKKTAWGKNIAYEVTTYLHVTKGLDKITQGDKLLSISIDGGKTWKFIQKGNDTVKSILLLTHPKEQVERMLL